MPTDRSEQFAAARALMAMVDEMIDGALLVDRDARIVWSNDRHVWFTEKLMAQLGLQSRADAIGQPVERVIPHSRMREVVVRRRPSRFTPRMSPPVSVPERCGSGRTPTATSKSHDRRPARGRASWLIASRARCRPARVASLAE